MGQPRACPQSSRLPGVSVIWLFFKEYLRIYGCTGCSLLLGAFSTCGELGLLLHYWFFRLLIEVASLGPQWLWHTGLAVPEACGIFPDQDWTRVLCVGERILNQWTTRKAWFYFWDYFPRHCPWSEWLIVLSSVWSEKLYLRLCLKRPCVNSQCVLGKFSSLLHALAWVPLSGNSQACALNCLIPRVKQASMGACLGFFLFPWFSIKFLATMLFCLYPQATSSS